MQSIKTCKKCNAEKPLAEFYSQRFSKTGVKAVCKACDNADRKAYYHARRAAGFPAPNPRRPSMEMRVCAFCGVEKRLNRANFSQIQMRREWTSVCHDCIGRILEKMKRGNVNLPTSYMRAYKLHLRIQVLQAYSRPVPECACCGESELLFLAIDHIHGGGKQQRRELNGEVSVWLRKNNYPEGYQVLCHNCNSAKGYYGSCPHEAVKALAA